MNVLVFGYGAMGKLLCDLLQTQSNTSLTAAIAPNEAEQANWIYPNIEAVNDKFEVIIDFSHPVNLSTILDTATHRNIPAIICTTGHSTTQLQAIEIAAQQVPIVLASNTSQGINLMHQLLAKAVQVLAQDFDIEIVEAHHNRKLDSPSGTAKSILETVQSNLKETYTVEYGREGMAKRQATAIGMHSLRGGTIVGEHSVIFAGEDEILEIKHTALSKKIFAKGAIRAAQWAVQQHAGLYDMGDVIT